MPQEQAGPSEWRVEGDDIGRIESEAFMLDGIVLKVESRSADFFGHDDQRSAYVDFGAGINRAGDIDAGLLAHLGVLFG